MFCASLPALVVTHCLGVTWLVDALVSASVIMWCSLPVSVSKLPFSYKVTRHWIGAHLDFLGPPFTLITSAKILFPTRVTLTGIRGQDVNTSFGEHD